MIVKVLAATIQYGNVREISEIGVQHVCEELFAFQLENISISIRTHLIKFSAFPLLHFKRHLNILLLFNQIFDKFSSVIFFVIFQFNLIKLKE